MDEITEKIRGLARALAAKTVRSHENPIYREFVEGNNIVPPAYLADQFRHDPRAQTRYALLEWKMPNLFDFRKYVVQDENGNLEEVVLSPEESERHEVALLRKMGLTVRIADLAEELPNATIDGDNFVMESVSREDLAAAILCLGGKGKRGSYLLWGTRILVQEDTVVFNGVYQTRFSAVQYGTNNFVLDPHQAAFLVLMTSASMLHLFPGKVQAQFRSAVESCSEFFHAENPVGIADDLHKYVDAGKFGIGIMMVGLNGPVFLKKMQDPQVAYEKADHRKLAIFAEPQGKCFHKISTLGQVTEIDGVQWVYVDSTDEAKLYKRLTLRSKRQARLIKDADVSALEIAGEKSFGRLVRVAIGPSLNPIYGHGLGSFAVLSSRDRLEDELGILVPKSFDAVAYGIRTPEELELLCGKLPKEGDVLPERITYPGCRGPKGYFTIPEDMVGGIVTKVITPQVNDFGTAFFKVELEIRETLLQAKVNGGLKGTISVGPKPVGPDSLEECGIAFESDDGLGPIEADLLVTIDGGKLFTKADASRMPAICADTLVKEGKRDKLAELIGDKTLISPEGQLKYSPKANYEGKYDSLLEYVCENYSRVTKSSHRASKRFYEETRQDLFLNGHLPEYQGGDEDVSYSPGSNVLGFKDILRFRAENGVYTIYQYTKVLVVWMLVKVEVTTVSQAVSETDSMLEVAMFYKAIGKHATAEMLTKGGNAAALSVVKTLKNLAYEPEDGEKVIYTDSVNGRDEANLVRLRKLAERDVPDWPGNIALSLYSPVAGKHFKLTRDALMALAETDAAHALGTTQAIVAYAAEGDWDQVKSLSSGLYASLSTIKDSGNFYKRINRGSKAVTAKRMAVTVPGAEGKCFLNRNSRIVRRLARRYGCSVEEVNGKLILGFRAPMFLAVPLQIVLVDWIPPDYYGVSPEIASIDEGDFDGDGYYGVPVTCPKAEEELRSFDVFAFKKQVHEACYGNNPKIPQHAVLNNRWESKGWARPALRPVIADVGKNKAIVPFCKDAMQHQIIEMPTDANRAHMALSLACQGMFEVEYAVGLMIYVWEVQLAGYSKLWSSAHKIDVFEDPDALLEYAETKLDMTKAFAEAWLKAWIAHAEVSKVKKFTVDPDGFVYKRVVEDNGVSAEAFVANLISAAMKKLAQGEQTPADKQKLISNLGRLIVVAVDKGGKVTKTIDVFNRLEELAAEGVPAASRLVGSVKRVQPLVHKFDAPASNDE